jgi:hypothetical protein
VLLGEVLRHEGVDGVSDSHYGVLQGAIASIPLKQVVEALTLKGAPVSALADALNSPVGALFVQAGTLQTQYDNVDRPKIFGTSLTSFGRIGCKLRYDAIYATDTTSQP